MQSNTTTVSRSRVDIPLILILLLSAFLNIWHIWDNGNANSYYTAAVTSMLQSFHNFFYASFDPAGFVTIDKPPVAFWLQTLFAAVFGVHGWSVTLPAALAGVGSVGLLYLIMKPTFGIYAARIAALFMAVTPVAVAVQRSNNVDGLLVFTLLLATWMLMKGIRLHKVGWILGAFALIGVAFNEKMLQAYMILPAVYVFYWLAFKVNWKKKLSVLLISTVILAAVSLSWPIIVDSVPASQRPYIGSSETNSVLELAFGYNGLSRLTGETQTFGSGGDMPGTNGAAAGANPGETATSNAETGSIAGNPLSAGMIQGGLIQPPGGGDLQRRTGGMFNTGNAGPLRLFQKALSGQASLLLPFAILSLVALFARLRRFNWREPKHTEMVFWLLWLIPVGGFFSIANFFHQYYLIMLAPPVVAIAGAGLIAQWRDYRAGNGWLAWLLPLNVAATTAFQLYVIYPYRHEINAYWFYLIAALGGLITIGLLIGTRMQTMSRSKAYLTVAATGALLLTPLYWSSFPMMNPSSNIALPYGGPLTEMDFGGGGRSTNDRDAQLTATHYDRSRTDSISSGSAASSQSGASGNRNGGATGGQTSTKHDRDRSRGGGIADSVNEKLLQYVTENNHGEKFLFAVTNANSASAYIIRTGKAVMAMGGYNGNDPILTVDKLKALIRNGEVKYFLLNGMGRGGSTEVAEWIKQHGTIVPSADWEETSGSVIQNSISDSKDKTDTNASGMMNPARDKNDLGGFGMMTSTLYEITPEDLND
ncbi:glycosyltransferase family 39 protein [Paenibacillus campi]|uniref:glycosyltransferase family 39 protein n=1 Tax=Paenibacillus campi TaxID=3106031 RepID=UPI002AFE2FC6|nr:glycosyltransferase family 39 protein [Paenibacillus sp. SGZ-1014]